MFFYYTQLYLAGLPTAPRPQTVRATPQSSRFTVWQLVCAQYQMNLTLLPHLQALTFRGALCQDLVLRPSADAVWIWGVNKDPATYFSQRPQAG